jgi:hypothetical protein
MGAAAERVERTPEARAAPARRAAGPDSSARALTVARAVGNRAFAGVAQRTLARDPIIGGVACFAESTMHVDRFAADVNTLEYDEDIARYNANEGRTRGDWGSALWDAWGYCYIAACHTRGNAESSTWFLGHAYDAVAMVLHEAWEASPLGWIAPGENGDTTRQDTYNRAVGSTIATHEDPEGDLYQQCFDAMMQGRLDLTAAGVPRGRRLRRRAGGS